MSRPGKQAAAARLAVAVQLVGSVCALLLAVCLALSFTLLREGHFAACLKKSGYLDTVHAAVLDTCSQYAAAMGTTADPLANAITPDVVYALRDEHFFAVNDYDHIYLGGVSLRQLEEDYKVDKADLAIYLPSETSNLEKNHIQVRYLGYYEKWHPQGAYYYSVEHGGFRPAPERTQGTYSKYNSIDDKIDDFFYYTTYIKYGIGRTTYDAAQEIRNEEITLDEGKALCKKFDGEYPDRFEKEIFKYLSLDRQHFPWASQLFEQPRMDRDYFMDLADRFRSPHIWKWEDNMWKLRYTPYEGDSEVLWGDPRGTHHEI